MLVKYERYSKYVLIFISCITCGFLLGVKPRFNRFIQPVEKQEVSQQIRRNGVKDLWLVEDKQRLHYHIESHASTLTVIPSQSSLQVVESMDNVRCWMQEKLSLSDNQPLQKIRFLKATEGTYLYHMHQFFVQNAFLAMYQQQGWDLQTQIDPKCIYFQGKAKEASFHLEGKSPQFYAEDFEANIESKI